MANETKLPSPDEVRAEIRAWLAANWKPTYGLVEWRNILVDGGWASPGWPSAWHGRDYTPPLVAIVDEEMRKAGAVGPARAGPRNLASARSAYQMSGRSAITRCQPATAPAVSPARSRAIAAQ